MLAKLLVSFFLTFCLVKSDVTFRDVTFRGYNMFTEKFKKTISRSNSLKDFLPETVFDKIEFKDQNIPVLYKGSLADLDDLDELVIENCGVNEIQPGVFKNVPGLRRLSLKGNNIKEIKEGVFNHLDLSTIDLSLNQIKTVDTNAFDDMPSLLNINLADNQIDKWDIDWFKNTPLLTRISMQNNSITKLPNDAFRNLIGSRKFGTVDLTLNIVLSYNKIKTIEPRAFNDLTKVNHLWLDNNQLEEFQDTLLEGVVVEDLRLNNNNIRCLDGDLAIITKAETTHLDFNPFDCDCLKNITEWVKSRNKNVDIFYSKLECTAQRVKNKMIALQKRLRDFSELDEDPSDPIK